jgi:hypothetical protein
MIVLSYTVPRVNMADYMGKERSNGKVQPLDSAEELNRHTS